jgi:type III pantothenate kinase
MRLSRADKAVVQIVADLGNSRLKWGRVAATGVLDETVALPLDDSEAWAQTWSRWQLDALPSVWSISTVNPPVAQRLGDFLSERRVDGVSWYGSARDVPVLHRLEQPETAGADRALAALAATDRLPSGRAGLVVSCGTAITVERITADGVWDGGVIAPGLGLSARALHLLTAQLPLIEPCTVPVAWGRSTRPALEAGLFWGVVGAVREILARQVDDRLIDPWTIWTGGDASLVAPAVGGPEVAIIPDLVLLGLIRASSPPRRLDREQEGG